MRLTLGRLNAAFTLAIRDRRLSVNPCAYVALPAEEESERTTWSEAQVHAFIATATADRLHAVWLLSLLGLRRGEALGLKWSDISFTDGTITVARSRVVVGSRVIEKSPKSRQGYRTLPLFEPVTSALEALYARQVTEKREAGPAYPAEIDGGYVAADEVGQPLHPERYSDEFGRLAALAEVPRCRLHDCRHSVNSLLEKLGVPDSLRAAWLGHTIVVNRGTYLHSRPEELAAISAALGEIFKAV